MLNKFTFKWISTSVAGAKGAVDQKNIRRYSMGTIPNARPTVNYSYLSNNAPARAGKCLGWRGLLSSY